MIIRRWSYSISSGKLNIFAVTDIIFNLSFKRFDFTWFLYQKWVKVADTSIGRFWVVISYSSGSKKVVSIYHGGIRYWCKFGFVPIFQFRRALMVNFSLDLCWFSCDRMPRECDNRSFWCSTFINVRFKLVQTILYSL